MKCLIILLVLLMGCRVNDHKMQTLAVYTKTMKIISPNSEYFIVLNKYLEDGAITYSEFDELQRIYEISYVRYMAEN